MKETKKVYPRWLEKLAKVFFLLRDMVRWGDVLRESKKLSKFKGCHAGQDCFVFLTGRSINDFKLSEFSDYITFGCNEIARHPDFNKLKLKYYAGIEPFTSLGTNSILRWFYPKMLKLLEERCNNPNMVCFFNYTSREFLKRKKLMVNHTKYFPIHQRVFRKLPAEVVLDRPNSLMQGVVYFMLSLAIWMGFKRIYLIGAGYTFEPYQWYHFYDPYSTPEATERAKQHQLAKPQPLHYKIKELSEKAGVEIINVCPEGHTSPIYQGIPIAEFKARFNLA